MRSIYARDIVSGMTLDCPSGLFKAVKDAIPHGHGLFLIEGVYSSGVSALKIYRYDSAIQIIVADRFASCPVAEEEEI